MANRIDNPFRPRQVITVPAGTPVHSMNPRHKERRVLARAQQITVHHTSNGWVDLWNDHKYGRGYVILPTVTWPGSGGYWQDIQVTPELLDANGLAPLVMADLDTWDRGHLDVEPSFDDGYTNRWGAARPSRVLV